MGFLSKAWKGVKKVFKSVGKAIKSAFKSVGKFMNKMGVVGQIGLLLAMPYIGAALGSLWSGVAGTTAAQASAAAGAAVSAGTATAAQAAIVAGTTSATASGLMLGGGFSQAVGGLMNSVGSFTAKAAAGIGKTWGSITEGVSSFVTEFSKTAASKLGFSVEGASANFFGPQSSWSKTTAAFAEPFQPVVKAASLIPGPLEGAAPGTFSKAQINAATEQLQGTLLPGGYSPVPTRDFTSPFTKPVNLDYSPVPKPLSSSSAVVPKAAVTSAAKPSLLSKVGETIVKNTEDITAKKVGSSLIATIGESASGSQTEEEQRQGGVEATVYEMFSLGSSPVAVAAQTPIMPLQVPDTYQQISDWAQQFAYFNTQGRAVA